MVATTKDDEAEDKDGTSHNQDGSSVGVAIFNFTNSMLGAGAIGSGGAIQASGGVVSVAAIVFFAVLSKLSIDMLIDLSVKTEGARNSYELLGEVACGKPGRLAVLISKFCFSFGCLIAYIFLVKDNLGSAIRNLLSGASYSKSGLALFQNDGLLTWVMGILVVLPLCLLRDMTPLGNASVVKILAMYAIVLIVVGLFFASSHNMEVSGQAIGKMTNYSRYERWFQVRLGLIESLGTFIFTFVTQHTANLAYESLRPDLRTVKTWRVVSTYSVLITAMVVLLIGLFVYMTFWEATESDLFAMYPPLLIVDLAKILLCTAMLLSFPLPFLTCRELIVISLPQQQSSDPERQPLVLPKPASETGNCERQPASSRPHPWIMPGYSDKQLLLPYHICLTVLLWGLTTFLAIASPSLGAVLNLVGCATGTVIAFVLPAVFSFRLEGYTHLSAFILVVGGAVGLIGTYRSLKELVASAAAAR